MAVNDSARNMTLMRRGKIAALVRAIAALALVAVVWPRAGAQEKVMISEFMAAN